MASGYVRGEHLHHAALVDWIRRVTGRMPVTAGFIIDKAKLISATGTWVTLQSGSSGPYIILIARNNPTSGTGNIQLRVTVDGTLLSTSGSLPYVTNNHFIGLPFGQQSSLFAHGPVMVRSSYSVEGYASVTGQYADIVTVQYSLP